MPRYDNLLLSTDFDTLKNDDSVEALLVIPGGSVVSPGTTNFETTVSVGLPESILVVSATNNINYPGGEYFSLSNTIRFDRSGSLGGVGGFAYSIYIRFSHVGGSNVRVIATISNSYGSALTLSPTTDSFTFRIRSIKVPRFS